MDPTKTYQILTGVQTSDDYPYGRERCHITFAIEFADKKGFRFVTQTTNPKNGRVNAPKKSTYCHFLFMYREEETGHIVSDGIGLTGYDSIAKLRLFLTNNKIEFAPEQSKYLWVCVIACIRGNCGYTSLREGVSIKELLETLRLQEIFNAY